MKQSFEQFFETGLKFVTLNNLLRRISVLQKTGDNIKMEREMNELEDLLVNILTTCSYCAQSQFEKRCPPCQALEDVLQGIADQYSNKDEKSGRREQEKKRRRVSESSEPSESSENEEPLESSESFETGESDESYKDESDSEVNLSSKEEVAEELEEDVDVEEEEDVRRIKKKKDLEEEEEVRCIKKKKRVRYVEEEEEDSSDIPVLPNRFEYRGDSVVHEGIEYPWVKAHMVRGVYKRPRREKRVRH